MKIFREYSMTRREIPAFARRVRSCNDGRCSSVRGILPGVSGKEAMYRRKGMHGKSG